MQTAEIAGLGTTRLQRITQVIKEEWYWYTNPENRMASAANLLRQYDKAMKELPLGHTDRDKIEAQVTAEYAMADMTEKALVSKYKIEPSQVMHLHDAVQVVSKILYRLGSRYTVKLVFQSPEAKKEGIFCAGLYSLIGRAIHIPGNVTMLRTILHELTHHFCMVESAKSYYGHQKEFCDMLELVYQAYSE